MEASLAAFREGRSAVTAAPQEKPAAPAPAAVQGPAHMLRGYGDLIAVSSADSPPRRMRMPGGLAKAVDFQDLDYGRDYLDRVAALLALDGTGHGCALIIAAAKYLANAMCYDDIIRVADLKTRAARFAASSIGSSRADIAADHRIHASARRGVLQHDAGAARRRHHGAASALPAARPAVNRGRHVHTDLLFWFTVLYASGGTAPHAAKPAAPRGGDGQHCCMAGGSRALAPRRYDLAVEVMRCRRLIKGYSDTHARASRNSTACCRRCPCSSPATTAPPGSAACAKPHCRTRTALDWTACLRRSGSSEQLRQ